MTFEWFAFTSISHPDLPHGLPGFLVALLYLVACVWMVSRNRHDFARLTLRQWLVLIGLAVAALLFAGALVIHNPAAGLPGSLSLPLLALLPVVIGAVWLGIGPATLLGLVAGLASALLTGWRVTEPLEVAIAGGVMGALMGQQYRGRAAHWLRQPALAAAVGSVCVLWPLQLLAIAATGQLPFLPGLDHLIAILFPTLGAALAGGLFPGLLVQLAIRLYPGLSPRRRSGFQNAPWGRHLSQRVAYALVPLGLLAIVTLAGVVASTSYLVATNLVVAQMGRSAANAGSGIPFFIQEGRGLIRNLAENGNLASGDPAIRQAQLTNSLRDVPFFQQMIVVDQQGQIESVYPPGDAAASTLTSEEGSRVKLALTGGVPTEVISYDAQGSMMSFVAAIGGGNSAPLGVLIGRTRLQDNPSLAPVIDILQTGVGSGWGLLIDNQNHVLLSPARPELVPQAFNLGMATEIGDALASGRAYRQVNADGTRNLVYILPVAGQSDWSVVLVEPNEVTLRLAIQIAIPTLALLLIILGIIGAVGFVIVHSITTPLEGLLKGVRLIGEGDLEHPVDVAGEDEVGQLGLAFEQMRSRLKNRLEEQERLLRVSRSVSSSLELFRTIPPILSSALDVTQAAGVRIALRRDGNGGLQAYSAGDAAAGMAALDSQLTDLVEKQGTVVISQVQRAKGSLEVESLPTNTQSLVALPLRSENSFHGILWLTYDHQHTFEQSELTFLGTLAGQAAVAIANARLLADAQEGRQKLEAILESTADGMIVVDNQGKIALMNPAAEQHFSVRLEQARGRPAGEIIHIPELATLLTDLKEPVAAMELPARSGRTLLANTSTIVSHDGTIAGRVALLRDITPIKELDNIKTVFLRMVSHDLRSPLTYMRGYLSLLPMSGDLNEAQEDALVKVNAGIQHISEMTERLLYLSRLKFGDEAELEFTLVDVEEMLHDVEAQLKSAADEKNIRLQIDAGQKLPLLLVDGILYQQALNNLIGNAIKYTPEDGEVTVRVTVDGTSNVTVSVRDNGIGIRPEDQEHLFEAFYRVPQREGESPRPGGTGLGLALVKAITEAHDGTVSVKSKYGEGSTFSISVPIRNPGDI